MLQGPARACAVSSGRLVRTVRWQPFLVLSAYVVIDSKMQHTRFWPEVKLKSNRRPKDIASGVSPGKRMLLRKGKRDKWMSFQGQRKYAKMLRPEREHAITLFLPLPVGISRDLLRPKGLSQPVQRVRITDAGGRSSIMRVRKKERIIASPWSRFLSQSWVVCGDGRCLWLHARLHRQRLFGASSLPYST